MRATGSSTRIWRTLSVILALLWTLTPLYWIVRLAFETNSELATFPPISFRRIRSPEHSTTCSGMRFKPREEFC